MKKEEEEKHLTKTAFEQLLKRAAQPIKQSRQTSPTVDQKEKKRRSGD